MERKLVVSDRMEWFPESILFLKFHAFLPLESKVRLFVIQCIHYHIEDVPEIRYFEAILGDGYWSPAIFRLNICLVIRRCT